MGRTQLQDAVPMTLGQEFTTYTVMIEEDRRRLTEAAALLLESNLGGTAIGTGINGHPRYAELACDTLATRCVPGITANREALTCRSLKNTVSPSGPGSA